MERSRQRCTNATGTFEAAVGLDGGPAVVTTGNGEAAIESGTYYPNILELYLEEREQVVGRLHLRITSGSGR